MSGLPLKEELYALAEQAVPRVAESDLEKERVALESFRYARADYDPERDMIITGLPAFERTLTALGSLPLVRERYGDEERLALQFVYGLLGNLPELTFNSAVFEATWEAFWKELVEPEWTWRGLANLKNFRSDVVYDPLDLGHGTTIRGRVRDELIAMGWRESHVERLYREWAEDGFGSHVILTEHKEPKTPANFLGNNLVHDLKASRAILALRLFKDGDIGMGYMWISRRVSFDLGNLGSQARSYPDTRAMRSTSNYTLDASELASVRDLYDVLLRLADPPTTAPVNLDLALRSFSDMYERHSFRADTRLVDTITAAEALLGTGTELRFRLSFRVAAILGHNHDDRVDLFTQMKDYYDVRSAVVHGSDLSSGRRRKLENQQAVRGFVRRLLAGFIRLTVTSGHPFDKQFFDKHLDISLLDDTTRSHLRMAMGLEESDGGDSP